jgi:hypothetical protein
MEIPPNGFYYHYKHEPDGTFNDHAYEVVGLARNTEDDAFYVMYRPLYDSSYIGKANVFVRPLGMFMEEVTALGKSLPRFEQITDTELISKLSESKIQMYGA